MGGGGAIMNGAACPTARYRCHLGGSRFLVGAREGSHSRESGNPVRRRHISEGLPSGFPLSRE